MKQVYNFLLIYNTDEDLNQLVDIKQIQQIDLFWDKILKNVRIEPDRKVVQDIIKKVSQTV